MRHAGLKFGKILATGLLLPALSLAAPSSSRLPTKKIEAAASDGHAAADLKCVPGPDGLSTCAHQDESFERAAQASSYLALYMSQYSDFAQKVRTKGATAAIQKSVLNCLQGQNCSDDDKKILTAVLIQYNLGKEVKSMILKNNTNQMNMASLRTPDGRSLWKGKKTIAPKNTPTYKGTFKLKLTDFSTVETFRHSAQSENERASLGEEFKKDYGEFIDTYTQTTARNESWHREYKHPPQTSGKTVHAVWDIDPNTKAPKMQTDQFMFDVAAQGNDHVREIIAGAKKRIEAPEIENVKDKPGTAHFKKDPAKALQFGAFGLGVPEAIGEKDGEKVRIIKDRTQIARDIAGEINKRISEKEAETKKINPRIRSVNVQLDVDDFDGYLKRIWPETGYKYKIPSSEK